MKDELVYKDQMLQKFLETAFVVHRKTAVISSRLTCYTLQLYNAMNNVNLSYMIKNIAVLQRNGQEHCTGPSSVPESLVDIFSAKI